MTGRCIFTYKEKVECQQKRSDTEPTKAVGHLNCPPGNGNPCIPGPAEPVVGSGNSMTSDFVFENTDGRWPESEEELAKS